MGVEMTKIIAFTAVGSYPSFWLEYGVASVYNVVDEIMVVNGGLQGYSKPALSNDNYPLKREHEVLKDLDIDKKIVEMPASWDYAYPVCQKGREELRARNLTIGMLSAYNRGADWILKFDSDQVFYTSVKQIRDLAEKKEHLGYIFWNYTDFVGDLYHIDGIKEEGTSDGSQFYRKGACQGYGGQGAPRIVEQFPHPEIKTAHLRRVVPENISEKEKYQFYFDRSLYHIWSQNEINEHPINRNEGRKLTFEEMRSMAEGEAKHNAKSIGKYHVDGVKHPNVAICPPAVCLMSPSAYVKGGHP